MAKIHIMEQQGSDDYRVILHFPCPSGSNSAAKTWKSVMLTCGRMGSTSMVEGTGPGQITAAEKATIVAGDIVELHTSIRAMSSGGGSAAVVEGMADILINECKAEIACIYKWYGLTIGV
jgi:hypothetical protein